jgi:hypothetical protein
LRLALERRIGRRRPRQIGTIIALAFMFSASGCVSASEVKKQCCVNALVLDSEILKAVLVSLTVDIGEKYLVVASEPRAWGLDRTWVESHLTGAMKQPGTPALAEMIADYVSRNAKGHLPIGLGVAKVRFVDAQELGNKFTGDALGGWKRFWTDFPSAAALVELSLPGYSSDRTWAIMTYFVTRGSTAGDCKVVLLRHSAGTWTMEWSEILFET